MQTFLPYSSFAKSARCLDRQRLGKQRVECLQIYSALTGESTAWRNHPATKMWAGYEQALIAYWHEVVNEWVRRGYRNTMILPRRPTEAIAPEWLGKRKFHSSHRAALLLKLPSHYSQFGWKEKPELNYWWPTKNS